LNILAANRQSGGEKSVTTLLYLLALQDCTKFPFRVVDEIHQGMDEVNDRNTFFQVMSSAMRKNEASQYFLVTPKLLPQLDLMEGVTVLVVLNGRFIPEGFSRPITFDNAFRSP
jgi:chromosome segregation ATPase